MAKSKIRKNDEYLRYPRLRKLLIEKQVVNSKPRKLSQKYVYEKPQEMTKGKQ